MAVVTIDNPPVNATSQAVRSGLLQAVQQAVKEGCSHGVICCRGTTFVAGGDITEFGKPAEEPHLPDVYNQLEASTLPWACLLYGTTLGGGLELALACDFRVALDTTRFALPEVTLGLVPGAGGSQRLPRLVGVELATDMVTSGRLVSAGEFHTAGGLDEIITCDGDTDLQQGQLLQAAETRLLAQLKQSPAQTVAVSARKCEAPSSDYFSTTRAQLKKKSKGATAPLSNLDAIEWAATLPFAEGQPRERELHLKLRNSAESEALRHVFFAQRQVTRPSILSDVKALQLKNIGIIGGGLMGGGIAAASLLAGYSVTVVETDEAAVADAKNRIEDILQGALSRGKLSEAAHAQAQGSLHVTDNFQSLAHSELVIEAVFEDLGTKRKVFSQVEQVVSDSCLIATNTSYLDPAQIAQNLKNPERMLGLHFFSPAHIMKLVEIVKTDQTSAQNVASAFGFARKLGKTGVLSAVCDGFIGNRMLFASRRQADYLLADGATPQQIDQAMRDFGMPMGPYELQDLTGLQIGWANRKRLAPNRSPSERYVDIADTLCERDRFGQRSNKGWYRYAAGSRKPELDNEVLELVTHYSERHAINRREFSASEIQQSLIAVLANEGACILEEGIAERALDIDMVKILGYGFPRWRGGPMFHATTLGDSVIRATLDEVQQQSPGSWQIAQCYGG